MEPPDVLCMTYDASRDVDPMNPVSAYCLYFVASQQFRAPVIISILPWLEMLHASESCTTAALSDNTSNVCVTFLAPHSCEMSSICGEHNMLICGMLLCLIMTQLILMQPFTGLRKTCCLYHVYVVLMSQEQRTRHISCAAGTASL